MADFKKSAVYQIYTKSFRDSNGDGIGDIGGVTEKLDYLKELGVDYIWMTPFFKSPLNDNGYDVADYEKIDPIFGTMEDVEHLIREADSRGMGLMFDMVFNHTSTEHPWFKKAMEGDPKYLAYYKFVDGKQDEPPTNWVSKFGKSAWEYVPHLKKWYLHLFDVSQADLNWDNPEVREELKKIIRFWKKKGVKGFRFDVVNLISKPERMEDDPEGDGRRFYTDGPRIHEYLKELVADTGIEDMVTVGEMSSTSLEHCIHYTKPEEKELSMVFNFHHLKVDYLNGNKWALKQPDIKELKNLFKSWQEGMAAAGGWNAVFWCNHDQPRAVSRFGDDKRYWKESAKMLASCIHLMRGTPYIYQGEELGMTNAYYESLSDYRDVESLNYYEILTGEGRTSEEALRILGARSRDNGRTPMQWSAEACAGFSERQPWLKIPDNYRRINAKEELRDEDSILNYYRRLIALRKEYPVIAEGDIRFFETEPEYLLAYERTWKDERLTVLCNFSKEELEIPGKLQTEGRLLIGNYEGQRAEGRVLRPYETAAYYGKKE